MFDTEVLKNKLLEWKYKILTREAVIYLKWRCKNTKRNTERNENKMVMGIKECFDIYLDDNKSSYYVYKTDVTDEFLEEWSERISSGKDILLYIDDIRHKDNIEFNFLDELTRYYDIIYKDIIKLREDYIVIRPQIERHSNGNISHSMMLYDKDIASICYEVEDNHSLYYFLGSGLDAYDECQDIRTDGEIEMIKQLIGPEDLNIIIG